MTKDKYRGFENSIEHMIKTKRTSKKIREHYRKERKIIMLVVTLTLSARLLTSTKNTFLHPRSSLPQLLTAFNLCSVPLSLTQRLIQPCFQKF
jgi:hypothetical protein